MCCGERPPDAAMQFHHRERATKRFELNGPGLYRRWDEVAAEAAKCDLVCANCHAELEAG